MIQHHLFRSQTLGRASALLESTSIANPHPSTANLFQRASKAANQQHIERQARNIFTCRQRPEDRGAVGRTKTRRHQATFQTTRLESTSGRPARKRGRGSRLQAFDPGAPVHSVAHWITTTSFLQGSPYQIWVQDVFAAVLATVGASVWVGVWRLVAKHQLLPRKVIRKLVHITSGLLFVLCWPLFTPAPTASVIAACVPLTNAVRLALLGLGIKRDQAAVDSISREGGSAELLRGPLYYTLVIAAATVAFWRTSPVGLVALCMMCGGDGLADIVGRRFGSTHKLPWNPIKSFAGSAAMWIGGAALSMGFITMFHHLHYMDVGSMTAALPKVALIALGSTLVESLPINKYVDDNISVPVSAAMIGTMLF